MNIEEAAASRSRITGIGIFVEPKVGAKQDTIGN